MAKVPPKTTDEPLTPSASNSKASRPTKPRVPSPSATPQGSGAPLASAAQLASADDPGRGGASTPASTSAPRARTLVRALGRIRLIEWLGFVAALVLGGVQATISFQQARISDAQTKMMRALGDEQSQSATLQAYIAATEHAGFADQDQRRMAHIAIDLFQRLERQDASYGTLLDSLPELTSARAEEFKRGRTKAQQIEIEHLLVRLQTLREQAVHPAISGDFSVVLVGNRDAGYAQRNYVIAEKIAKTSGGKFSANVYRNSYGFYLVTLSGFANADDARRVLQSPDLRGFAKPYVSTATDWTPCQVDAIERCGSRPAHPMQS